MKVIQFYYLLFFLFLFSTHLLSAQNDTLSKIDAYDFEAEFNYQGSNYKYSVSEKGDDWYSLVIWRKNTLLEGEAKMMEVYSTHIMIEDEMNTTNNKNVRIRIQYAEKQGYVWKPYEHDFMQVVFLIDNQKVNYAPFGSRMIDRSKHSSISTENLITSFDNQTFTLSDAVKTSVEFFIMKYPKLFYM